MHLNTSFVNVSILEQVLIRSSKSIRLVRPVYSSEHDLDLKNPLLKNKTVLLRDHKRRTARGVTSRWGSPTSAGGPYLSLGTFSAGEGGHMFLLCDGVPPCEQNTNKLKTLPSHTLCLQAVKTNHHP